MSALWLHAAVTGNSRRCHAVQRNLLWCRQLDRLGETSGKGRMDRHHKARGTLTGLRPAAAPTRPTATLCHRSPECLTHQRRLARKQVQFLFDEVFRLSGKAHETLSSYGLNGITEAVSFLFIFLRIDISSTSNSLFANCLNRKTGVQKAKGALLVR